MNNCNLTYNVRALFSIKISYIIHWSSVEMQEEIEGIDIADYQDKN